MCPGLYLRSIQWFTSTHYTHILTYIFSPLSIPSLSPYTTSSQVLKESLALMFLQVRV